MIHLLISCVFLDLLQFGLRNFDLALPGKNEIDGELRRASFDPDKLKFR
jgi:hypothetical protein